MEGKRRSLPVVPPLRTVRVAFTTYSSSIRSPVSLVSNSSYLTQVFYPADLLRRANASFRSSAAVGSGPLAGWRLW